VRVSASASGTTSSGSVPHPYRRRNVVFQITKLWSGNIRRTIHLFSWHDAAYFLSYFQLTVIFSTCRTPGNYLSIIFKVSWSASIFVCGVLFDTGRCFLAQSWGYGLELWRMAWCPTLAERWLDNCILRQHNGTNTSHFPSLEKNTVSRKPGSLERGNYKCKFRPRNNSLQTVSMQLILFRVLLIPFSAISMDCNYWVKMYQGPSIYITKNGNNITPRIFYLIADLRAQVPQRSSDRTETLQMIVYCFTRLQRSCWNFEIWQKYRRLLLDSFLANRRHPASRQRHSSIW